MRDTHYSPSFLTHSLGFMGVLIQTNRLCSSHRIPYTLVGELLCREHGGADDV
jgi:hypothetical protein